MQQASLGKEEREKVFQMFLKNRKLKFSEIEKGVGIRSNHLSYHLEQMQKDGIVRKEGQTYTLTENAEQLLPFFNQMTGKEVGVLPVVLVAIKHKGKICLLKREKRPYKGYWGLIGGKLKLHESIPEAALREAKEETGLECEFEGINAVVHERVNEEGIMKHAFLFVLTTVKPKSDKLWESEEGKVAWFDPKKLDKNTIIPSDLWMIQNHLLKSSLPHIVLEQKGEKLTGFRVE
jgi:ADP-ribose pyrophosphatase YjhB (NUDIX family)